MTDIGKYNVSEGMVGKFDITKASKEEKLKFLEAMLEQFGEGNTHIVITSKADADKISLATHVGGADVMA